MARILEVCGCARARLTRGLVAAGTLVCAAGLAAGASQGDPPRRLAGHVVETWTLEDGLPQNSVNDLLQSDDEFLWLATFGGLARFDGLDFQIFELAEYPELGTNRLLCLHQDGDGDLWIGTQERGVVRLRDGVFRSFRGQPGAPRGSVLCIEEAADGGLWFGGESLCRLRDGEFESIDGVTETVRALHDLGGGRGLLLATARGLALFREGRTEWIAGLEDLGESGAMHVSLGPDGAVWVFGQRRSARLVEHPRWHVEPLNVELESVSDVLPSAPGSAWVAERSGLALVDLDAAGDEIRLELRPLANLDLDRLSCILRDREGNLWLGAESSGLTRVSWVPFQYPFEAEAPLGPVDMVIPVADGGVTTRLTDGSLRHVSPDLGTRLLPAELGQGPPGSVLHYSATPEGRLMVSVNDQLSVYDMRAPTRPALRVRHGVDAPSTLLAGRDGVLWIGSAGRLTRFEDGEHGSWELPGTPASMNEAPDGTLWCVGTGFVTALRAGRIERSWTRADGLPPGELRALHTSEDGTAWIASYGGGLCRIRDDEIATYTRADGLLDNALGSVLEDDFGRLWINSNLGALVLRIADLHAYSAGELGSLPCRVLDTGEGNGSLGVRTPDGRLWLPTIRGLAVIDPAGDSINPFKPNARVEALRANGRDMVLAADASIPAGRGGLEIAYTAPAFRSPEHVLFRYRLEGYEDEWVDAGGRRVAIYTGVPPGAYSFRVAARNEDGLWGEPSAPIEFEVRPHFRQTGWFYALVVATIALAILGLHKLRLQAVRSHDLMLQHEMRERLRAEEEWRRSEERLRESTKLEAVGRLAGGIAHDFNNVLTAILGHADLLRDQLARGSTAGADENVTQIRTCGERAAELTRQLLAFARQQVRRPRALDPGEVLAGLEPMLRRLLPEPVRLEIEGSRRAGTVVADRSQLEQVLMNLVLNARDALSEGGLISIETSRGPSGADAADEVRIAVSDDGRGIPEEVLPRVFEPFFTTKESSGTGLGLASVQAIVEQSGGRVEVSSRPGEGTTFEIFLPAIEGEAESLESAEGAELGGGGDETVLVCDDYGAVRDLIASALRARGYGVLVAEHPEQALALARDSERPIDLLVTDLVMPGMDGHELARQVEDLQPNLRVLLVTGYDAKVVKDASGKTAGHALLQKPFTTSQIQERVRELLDVPSGVA